MNNEVIKYNLEMISDIDKDIENNRKSRNDYINSYKTIFRLNKFFTMLSSSKVLTFMIVKIALVMFLLLHNPVIVTLVTTVAVLLYNIIIRLFIEAFTPSEEYYNTLDEYDKLKNELVVRRNLYISMYDYSVKGESSLLNNIKLKINNKEFVDYELYKNAEWLSNKSATILEEMSLKEKMLVNSIKNRIDWELNSNMKYDDISNDKLKEIYTVL